MRSHPPCNSARSSASMPPCPTSRESSRHSRLRSAQPAPVARLDSKRGASRCRPAVLMGTGFSLPRATLRQAQPDEFPSLAGGKGAEPITHAPPLFIVESSKQSYLTVSHYGSPHWPAARPRACQPTGTLRTVFTILSAGACCNRQLARLSPQRKTKWQASDERREPLRPNGRWFTCGGNGQRISVNNAIRSPSLPGCSQSAPILFS